MYSLGIVLWEIVSKDLPFFNERNPEIVKGKVSMPMLMMLTHFAVTEIYSDFSTFADH